MIFRCAGEVCSHVGWLFWQILRAYVSGGGAERYGRMHVGLDVPVREWWVWEGALRPLSDRWGVAEVLAAP
jgi:hypothetical protein